MKRFERIVKLWTRLRSLVLRAVEDVLGVEKRTRVTPQTPKSRPSIETHKDVDLPSSMAFDGLPAIYAIGDIHGRYDLLHRMLDAINHDCSEAATSEIKPQVVFLGDYIDRGFQSKKVIDTLIALKDQPLFDTVFLKGNHEDVLQTFLKDSAIGGQWSSFGGRETLISYGVAPPRSLTDADDWLRAHHELREKIPESHVAFLKSLKTFHQIGPFGFVHAGVRSGIPFEEQKDADRLWIRDEFLGAQKREDLFIIHGHSPTDVPYADHRRINVDTGAYYSGRLTAVKLDANKALFLTI